MVAFFTLSAFNNKAEAKIVVKKDCMGLKNDVVQSYYSNRYSAEESVAAGVNAYNNCVESGGDPEVPIIISE